MRLPNDEPFSYLGKVHVEPFKLFLASQEEALWHRFTHRTSKTALNLDVDSIVFRYGIGQGAAFGEMRGAFELFKEHLPPLLAAVPEPQRLRLARLKPGGNVFPHIDVPKFYDLRRRVHLVIQTNDNVLFTVGEKTINMGEGECWEINNKLMHSVVNKGSVPRIHLVVDSYAQ